MSKTKILLSATALSVIAYLGVGSYVHFYDKEQGRSLIEASELPEDSKQVAAVFFNNGCQYCHTEKANLPFYAKFPLVETMVNNDIKQGNKFFDLNNILEGMKDPSKLSEVNLAKLERVILNKEMPIPSFKLIHWGSGLNEQEEKTVLTWIRNQRQAYFLPHNLKGADSSRSLQPIPDSIPTDPKKVALGFMLYHDTRLSGNNTVSCHTCHQLKGGGVDGLATSTGIHGKKGGINAPTVYNAAFNFVQFWDGRAKDLADQAGGPPFNPVEMGSKDWQQIIDKLAADKEFTQQFLDVYPELNGKNITDAIGEFEKTLITPNSAFDLYLKGDKNALTEAQVRGYQLFVENKCDTCHSGAAMGGQSFEYMGLYDDYFAARGSAQTDADKGRFAVTKNPADMHKFKVPTLRNIALTAPYMHDARTDKLREAVKIMLHYQRGKDLPEKDVDDITAFLESLTGQYQGETLQNSTKAKP